MPKFASVPDRHRMGYWTKEENRNIRQFLDSFARKRCFDPLNPANWYQVKRRELEAEGGSGMIQHVGSFAETIVRAYPESRMKKENFPNFKDKDWTDSQKQLEFFSHFAQSNRFDPLVPENWYGIKRRKITKAGGNAVLKYHQDSHIVALLTLYPELTWKKEGFARHSKGRKGVSRSLQRVNHECSTGFVLPSLRETCDQ